jgi:uncharacterized protein YigE (DUF2233 family)
MKRLTMFFLLWVLGRQAFGAPRFTVVTVDPAKETMQLFLNDQAGVPFKGFKRLGGWLAERNEVLVFGMNAGMYHADFKPVGLLVQNGKQVAPLNLADGKGNFFLKPNGVFLLTKSGPMVIASNEYPYLKHPASLATQTGPLLLRHGKIHKAFNPRSQSRHIRNGVGVAGGKAVFAISETPVTFYEMAAYFRDQLHCSDALYLDGAVSSLHSDKLARSDAAFALGPILGVVGKRTR